MEPTKSINSPEYHQGKRRLRLRNFVFIVHSSGSVLEVIQGPRERKRLLPKIDEALLEAREELMADYHGLECITARSKNLQRVKQSFPNLKWKNAQITRIQI